MATSEAGAGNAPLLKKRMRPLLLAMIVATGASAATAATPFKMRIPIGPLVATTPPTLGAFNVPDKHLGDPMFTLAPPDSDSSGAWTFTIDDPAVATVGEGGVVTIVGTGAATVTATQAAKAPYEGASVTAPLRVAAAGEFQAKLVRLYAWHAAALTKNDELWMSGNDQYGQFGNGAAAGSTRFSYVMSDVADVQVGGEHTVVLKKDGTAWVAGRNNYGQLGLGDNTDRASFVQVASNVAAIGAGVNATFIVAKTGVLLAAGEGTDSQLGLGGTANVNTLTPVPGVSGATAVFPGYGNRNTVVMTLGGAMAAGRNVSGMLGVGNTLTDQTTFAQVLKVGAGWSPATDPHPEKRASMAPIVKAVLKDCGMVFAEGVVYSAGSDGCGGLPYYAGRAYWYMVPVLTDIVEVVTPQSDAGNLLLALTQNGALIGVGSDPFYKRLNGMASSSTPVQMLDNVASIATFSGTSYAIRNDGTVWSGGYSSDGALGRGHCGVSACPWAESPSGAGAVAVFAGINHAMLLMPDGTLKATGYNRGQLGVGQESSHVYSFTTVLSAP